MTARDTELDAETPDAFTAEHECRARRTTLGVIGVRPHTRVCREPVDDHAHHDGRHECTCGAQW